jgi:hypothetical protein
VDFGAVAQRRSIAGELKDDLQILAVRLTK